MDVKISKFAKVFFFLSIREKSCIFARLLCNLTFNLNYFNKINRYGNKTTNTPVATERHPT